MRCLSEYAAEQVNRQGSGYRPGRTNACLAVGKYEIDLVKNFLGPALVLNKYVERWLAWHGYMGTPNAMSQVHEAVATKNTLWTEGRPTIGTEYQTILTRFKFGSDRRIFHGRDRYIDAEEERSMASTRTCGHNLNAAMFELPCGAPTVIVIPRNEWK